MLNFQAKTFQANPAQILTFHAFVMVVFIVILLYGITISTIYGLAIQTTEQPKLFINSIQSDTPIDINFSFSNCPRVTAFNSQPIENPLLLKITADSNSANGVFLSINSINFIAGQNFTRESICYSAPGQSCTLPLTNTQEIFTVLVHRDTIFPASNQVYFSWHCEISYNRAYTSSVILFIIFIILSFILGVFIIVYWSIILFKFWEVRLMKKIEKRRQIRPISYYSEPAISNIAQSIGDGNNQV